MPNSDLINKSFQVPDELVNILNSNLSAHQGKENIRGVQRLKDIVDNPSISYAQMKRLKNYFDNYDGDDSDTEYQLLGDEMKNWVQNALKTSRDAIYNVKNARMMAGEDNQFIDPHEKDKDNSNPTGIQIPKLHKMSKSKYIMLDRGFTEEVNRIKQLIKHMDNKTLNN